VLAARRIFDRLLRDQTFTLTKARAAYREEFGISPKDKSIAREFTRVVEKHFIYPAIARMKNWSSPEIAIPVRIAVALFLGEHSGRKKGRQRPYLQGLGRWHQMKKVVRLKEKYMMEQRMRAEDASRKAAEEVHRTFAFRGRRQSYFTVPQIIECLRQPLRYGIDMKALRAELAEDLRHGDDPAEEFEEVVDDTDDSVPNGSSG